jgi:hypothetical protein
LGLGWRVDEFFVVKVLICLFVERAAHCKECRNALTGGGEGFRERLVPVQTWLRLGVVIGVLMVGGLGKLWAQTNPAPQSLPYLQAFGAASFTALPLGVAAWNGLSGASISSSALAASSVPLTDATMAGATATQTTGGSYGYATGGNGRFYIQTSSNSANGVNQLAIAINTMGRSAISLGYDVEIVSAQPRTVGVLCQYRVGTSGGWTTLTPVSGMNPYSQAGGTVGVKTSPQISLPINAENQPVVQIRWAVWRGTEAGNSSGVAIDNIGVSGTSTSIALSASVAPASVPENAGLSAATLTVTRTGETLVALPVTLLISDLTEASYTGPNPFVIPAGQASVSVPIHVVDDDALDGTQVVSLQVSANGASSTSAVLSVLDNEDAFSPPPGYYSAAAGLSGVSLKAALKVIASPANYRAYAYADTYAPLRAIWEDPNNGSNLITVYSGSSVGKNAAYFPGGPSPDVSWSREHVWPDSFGLDPDNVNPGSTGLDAGPDFTDLFNLRPCLQTVNTQRGNRFFDETAGVGTIPVLAPLCSFDADSWEARDVEKGDLARSLFYMAMRYDGSDANTLDLELANVPSTSLGRFASLAMLLRWNEMQPVGQEERKRNQTVFATYQRNRNPFVDHPEYINLIWGNVRIEKLVAAVTEGGAVDTYGVALGSQPTANVTVTPAVALTGQVSVTPVSLTFTPANWNQPQAFSIAAVNDSVYEATARVRVQHSVTSTDSRYAVLVPLDVDVTVSDNDPVIAPTTLPVAFGGPWNSLPTGFLRSGLGTPYAGSLGEDTGAGSAKFDAAGGQLTISFDAAPQTLSFRLKGNPSTGTATSGSFVIGQSADGVDFATVRTITNKDNTDQIFSDSLAGTSRYVSFRFSDKVSGNLQLDGITISAAPLLTHLQSWRQTHFGSSANSGLGADVADSDFDGLPNLIEYAFGFNPRIGTSSAALPKPELSGGNLILTVTQPSGVTGVAYGAEYSTSLAPGSWIAVPDTGVPPVRVFSRSAGSQRLFMRLVITNSTGQ